MKFYGITFGCTEVYQAEPGFEVIRVITFSEESTDRTNRFIGNIATAMKHKGEYELIRQTDPVISQNISLHRAMEFFPHHIYHYKVKESKFEELKLIINKCFPKHQYIVLK